MKVFMFLLLCVALVIPVLSYGADRDSNYFDKRGNYQGFSRDNDRETSFYNNHGAPAGTYYKDTGAVFDGHNKFQGFIIDTDNDD
jgi:hypothetical protein